MAMERSKRLAGTSYAHSDAFQTFLQRLRKSDKNLGEAEGRVLRLKQFLPSDVGPKIMDTIIDALALNTNVEALYIQNFEKGMDDERLAHLVAKVLKQGRIWALNIGENFQITHYAWGLFLEDLPETAVSYLYVSEHHLKGTKLKDRMRDAIRENRNRGGQRAVEVIKKITNMWYNPKTPEQLEVSRKRREEREKLKKELERREKEKERERAKAKVKVKVKVKKGKKLKKKMSVNKKLGGKRSFTKNVIQLSHLVDLKNIELGSKLKYVDGKNEFFGILKRCPESGEVKIWAMEDDKNKYEARVWSSPSQFGVNCIRLRFPERQAVNGWDNLWYGETNLGQLRRELSKTQKFAKVKTLQL